MNYLSELRDAIIVSCFIVEDSEDVKDNLLQIAQQLIGELIECGKL